MDLVDDKIKLVETTLKMTINKKNDSLTKKIEKIDKSLQSLPNPTLVTTRLDSLEAALSTLITDYKAPTLPSIDVPSSLSVTKETSQQRVHSEEDTT